MAGRDILREKARFAANMDRFYFDHNATTPLAPEARAAFVSALDETFGNASSVHQFGQDARRRFEAARRQVAQLLGAEPGEIVFTSGGTESNNAAILSHLKPGSHCVTTTIEHPAVLAPSGRFDVTRVAVDASGVVDPEAVRRALRPETAVVSIMHANNETGTIQPIAAIAQIVHAAGALLHVDGVQAAGKIPVDVKALGADYYSISAHKIYGPKGIGALYARPGAPLEPVVTGGKQERGRRPGTENVPAAAAFGAAAEAAMHPLPLAPLRDRLEAGIRERIPGAYVNGTGPRVPNTANVRFDGIDSEALLIALDLRGFAVSAGAACSSGAVEPSHVLTAIGLTREQARSSVRFSLGRSNTAAQVDALLEALAASVHHLRKLSPAYA